MTVADVVDLRSMYSLMDESLMDLDAGNDATLDLVEVVVVLVCSRYR